MNPYLLLTIGLLLVFLEFFLPGAVLGIAGGCLILTSVIFYAVAAPSALATFLFTLAAVIGVVVIVKLALYLIRRSGSKDSMFSDAAQENYLASEYDPTMIGKIGVAASVLKPSGFILVGGKRCQALSQSGYVEKETEVTVISGRGSYLVVKPKSLL